MDFPITWRTVRVWQRNRDSFLRLWKTEAWPPFVEPLLQLGALGFGLGTYVDVIDGQTYREFIAPGILAASVLFTSSFECLFGTFVRMQLQRTFDAIIATPLSIEEVVFGELLWGATRGTLAALGVLVVVSALGLVASPWVALALPLAFLAGFMFSAIAMSYTSMAPSFDVFNYYITLGLTPMFLFSGVFFPVNQLPPNVAWLPELSPLYHVVRPFRQLARGTPGPELWLDLLFLLVVSAVFGWLGVVLMRRRLIK